MKYYHVVLVVVVLAGVAMGAQNETVHCRAVLLRALTD